MGQLEDRSSVSRGLSQQGQRVSCILPTLNESGTIRHVIREVKRYADEVIVVDGHSYDGTSEAAAEEGARVFIQKTRGKGGALREAFSYATGDLIVMMDGDGSMRASEIPNLLDEIARGNDVVIGSRFLKNGGSEDFTFIRKLGNLFFVRAFNLVWKTKFTDVLYGFKAFRVDAIRKLTPNLRSNNFEIETEILIKSIRLGFRIAEAPCYENKRTYGRSHLNSLLDGFSILISIIWEQLGK